MAGKREIDGSKLAFQLPSFPASQHPGINFLPGPKYAWLSIAGVITVFKNKGMIHVSQPSH